MRRKKRVKKKFERFAAEESAPNSTVASRDGSDQDDDEDGEASVDSDMTDGEREMMKTLKQKHTPAGKERGGKGSKGNYAKKSVICLECKKCFVDRKGLKKHMRANHQSVTDWSFS